MGQVVRLQLVESGFYVRVPFLFVQAVAVEVERHHELAQVRGLLDLQDQGVWSEGVQNAARHVHGVSGGYSMSWHDGPVVLRLERAYKVLARAAFFDAGQDRGAVCGPEDVPRLRLAVRFAVLSSRRLVVSVQVDGKQVGGVEEF